MKGSYYSLTSDSTRRAVAFMAESELATYATITRNAFR